MDTNLEVEEEFINNTYSYLITDLRDNSVISELPFTGVSYEKNLSKSGNADLSIIINEETLEMNPNAFTYPGRTGLYIFRNEQVMWGGVIFKRTYSSESRTLSLTCKSFEEYFYHIIQRKDINVKDIEQLDIARRIVTENNAHKDLLISVDTTTKSGIRRERNMFTYEFKTVGEELERLASLINGFDWNVDVTTDPNSGVIKRDLNFYYPERGKRQENTDLIFEFPGAIRSFTISDDSENAANIVSGIGAGEGTEQLSYTKTDQNQIVKHKFPRLEGTKSYKSVSELSTLKAHVDSELNKSLPPVTVIEVVLRGDGEGEHEVGTYEVGDWARFRIEDPFLPEPIDQMHRITGYKVSVEDESGLETVTLVLGDDDANLADESELG